MDTNRPRELVALISRVDDALVKLRREIQRGKQLLRATEDCLKRMEEGGVMVGPALAPHR
jgi:hypothetical protein